MSEVKNCSIECEHYKSLGPYMFQCVRPEQTYCPCDPTEALKEPPPDLMTVKAQDAKADAGKLQIHMVPMQIVRDIAEVRMYGTVRYGGDENNWRKVELMRYVDAMLRHVLAFAEDIHSVDEESGIPHYKHAECNLAFISELLKDWKGDADGRAGNAAAESP